MEIKNYVEFKKERDLGAIITDAFKHIRIEWKQFNGLVFKIAVVPILLAIAALLYYSYSASTMLSGIDFEGGDNTSLDIISNTGNLFSSMFLMVIFAMVAYVFVNLGSLYYIKSYIDNNGVINKEEIKQQVKDKFWSFIGLGILTFLIVMASALLCFFPIFYTGIVLSLATSILVFENKSVSETISRSFNFIKGHFWDTFGVLFVVGLLITVLGYIFQIPVLIYQLIKMGTVLGTTDPTEALGLFNDPIYLSLMTLSYVGKYLFYSITLITTVFIYFDINEQKNATGTIERIDSLGN